MEKVGSKYTEKDAELLRRLYWEEGLSLEDIGWHYNVTAERVRQLMIRFGIPRRSMTERAKGWKK